MNCKECRNLLMDYIDNELDNDRYQAVKEHVHTCSSCSHEEALQRNIAKPFRSAERFNPPARVWSSVQGKIAKQEKQTYLSDFMVWFNTIASPQRMKLVTMAASILLIVSVFVTMHGVFVGQAVNDYLEDSAHFMAQLSYSEDENLFTIDEVKFDTMLEVYFL